MEDEDAYIIEDTGDTMEDYRKGEKLGEGEFGMQYVVTGKAHGM